MPTISVIIPNYNHAQYLEQRIDSVLNQTYQDFEVIILDDCSPDQSRIIIEQYRDHPKVSHIIFNTENSGTTFKQWQKGIELAKGEWIWIAESDDWCEMNFLAELMIQNLNKDISIAFVQTYMYYENTNLYVANYTGSGMYETVDGVEFVKSKMLPFNGIWNASQALFRRENYLQVSQKYLEFRFCGDWIFWVEMALMGKVHINGKFLSYFRKHDLDVTSSVSKSGIRYIEEVRALIYFKSLLGSHFAEFKNFYTHYCNVLLLKKGLNKEDYQGLMNVYKQHLSFKYLILGKIKTELITLRDKYHF